MMKTSLLLLVPVAMIACSDGAPIDIGHDQAELTDFAGNWDGYAEAYVFARAQSSDRVRVTVGVDGTGTLEVGDAGLLPPATNPDLAPPQELTYESLRDGFIYSISDVTVDAGRIRFDVDVAQIIESWCAIQTSFDVGYGGYSCVPLNDVVLPPVIHSDDDGCQVVDASGAESPISCFKVAACGASTGAPCACSAAGCHHQYTVTTHVDGVLDPGGQSITGTLIPNQESSNGRVTIRLHR